MGGAAGFAPEGGAILVLARSLAVGALLSVFGTLVFRVWVAPRALARMDDAAAVRVGRVLLWLTRCGFALAVAAMLVWVVAQAADMASAHTMSRLAAALPVVVRATLFGRLATIQAAALLAGLAVGWRAGRAKAWGALALAGLGLVLQAGHGHSASMGMQGGVPGGMQEAGYVLLLGADVLHLLGAGAWLGALLPLLLLVRLAPAKAGATAARWFSPMGKLAVGALVVSAAVQGWVLVGSIAGLVGTAYGWMVLAKTALSAVLLGFAWANRYWFAPALLGTAPEPARRLLLRSLAVQTGFGVTIVVAAGLLSSLEPAMHVQPVWPFAWRFSLDAVRGEPAFRGEVAGALLGLAGAAGLLGVAVLLRRRGWWRWLAVAMAGTAGWVAVPHLDLLFVPASPTSYWRSPTGFASASIAEGASLYAVQCAGCHGAEGRGDGPLARGLAVPPADLTAAHLWAHSDGELFWWLSHGIEGPGQPGDPAGGLVMPGFAGVLSEAQRWGLIDFVRARNAGLARAAGTWSPPLQAPGVEVQCGGTRVSMAGLRGGFVRVVLGSAGAMAGIAREAGPGAGAASIVTVLAGREVTVRAGPGVCIAGDAAVAEAYGVVSGLRPDQQTGAQVLVDAQGWLRAVQPGPVPAAGGWDDAAVLGEAVHAFAADPVAGGALDGMTMPMPMGGSGGMTMGRRAIGPGEMAGRPSE